MKQLSLEVLRELESMVTPSEFTKIRSQIKLNEQQSNSEFIIYNVSNEFMAKFFHTVYSEKIASIFEKKTQIKPTIIFTSKQGKIQQIIPNKKIQSSILIPSYIFDNFVVGESNKMAFLCSQKVATNPGEEYNPLFLYGGSGLGKTHLLQSIGNYAIQRDKTVICVTSEQFVNDFTTHYRASNLDKFQEKYRNCDFLLIDDIQFLGKTETIQESFFHTFNELKLKNKQIVMTSDKAPKYLTGFEERMKARFESGLMVDIAPPDLNTKIQIIKQKSEMNKINIDKDIVEYIAINMGNNIREIESAINKINAFSSLMRIDITIDIAKTILQDNIKCNKRDADIEDIVEFVARELNIKVNDIKNITIRNREVVNARKITIYLCNKQPGISVATMVSFFGFKDHSAISHNIKKINQNIEENEYLKIRIKELESKILKKERM